MKANNYDEYVKKHNDRRERIIAENKARRAKELKKNIITVVLTFVLVLGLSITLGSFLSKAQSDDEPSEVKCFSSIMVGFGETVEDVIEENYDTVHYASLSEFQNEVYSINSIDEHTDVRPGNYVIIPYFTLLAAN